jgi:hypothetical protein
MGGEILKRVNETQSNIPYYQHSEFNWDDTSKWINDQHAINYWIRYIKPNRENNYPDDFSSKTY